MTATEQSGSILYVVRFTGPFGFIKPWTAVRDETTYSQTFLTPSIVEGMRQKLEVGEILRHRLQHGGLDIQQERTQSAGWKIDRKQMSRQLSILKRGVMLQPTLSLAFANPADAEKAARQHICLCRNEDVLLPIEVLELSASKFDELPGIELMFERTSDDFSSATTALKTRLRCSDIFELWIMGTVRSHDNDSSRKERRNHDCCAYRACRYSDAMDCAPVASEHHRQRA